MNIAELKILDFIQEHFQCAFMDFIMPKVSWLAEYGIFWIAVALVMLISKKYRKVGLMLGVALILGLTVGNGLVKNLVARPRPYDVSFNELGIKIDLLVKPLKDYAFPSGHSLASFEACSVLLLTEKKFGIPAFIAGILVMFSRMYLYVHYLTDCIGGALLGILFGVVGYIILNKYYPWIDKNVNPWIEEKITNRLFKKA